MKPNRREYEPLSGGTYYNEQDIIPFYMDCVIPKGERQGKTLTVQENINRLVTGIEVIVEYPFDFNAKVLLHVMNVETTLDRQWQIVHAEKIISNYAFTQGKHVYYWPKGIKEISLSHLTSYMFVIEPVVKSCDVTIAYYGTAQRRV